MYKNLAGAWQLGLMHRRIGVLLAAGVASPPEGKGNSFPLNLWVARLVQARAAFPHHILLVANSHSKDAILCIWRCRCPNPPSSFSTAFRFKNWEQRVRHACVPACASPASPRQVASCLAV